MQKVLSLRLQTTIHYSPIHLSGLQLFTSDKVQVMKKETLEETDVEVNR